MTTWTALTTLTGQEGAEALAAAMERLRPAPVGVGVMEIEDGSALREVGGYFVEPPDEAGLAVLAAAFDARHFAVSRLDERDWVAQVQRELTPVEAGRFVLYGTHDAHRIPANKLGLRIEAAMAFGTGHHASTKGCLLLLDRLIRRGGQPRRVADIGCGTGVLAMAAARVWRVPALATDIDPVAVWTARENIAANRLTPWVRVGEAVGMRGTLLRSGAPYDLVFANILAGPLKRMAPELAQYLALGGRAVLSGLLRSQAPGVEAVYAGHGLRREDRVDLGEWTSLMLRKGGSGRLKWKGPPRGRP